MPDSSYTHFPNTSLTCPWRVQYVCFLFTGLMNHEPWQVSSFGRVYADRSCLDLFESWPVDWFRTSAVWCCLAKKAFIQKVPERWVVVSNICYFHPYLGKSSNLTSIHLRWVETTTSLGFCEWIFFLGNSWRGYRPPCTEEMYVELKDAWSTQYLFSQILNVWSSYLYMWVVLEENVRR